MSDPSGVAPAPASETKQEASGAAAKLKRLFQGGKTQKELVRTRRRLVGFLIGGFLTANFLMFLRFFFSRTIFEPKTIFSVGSPVAFSIGVDTGFQRSRRIWVVRTTDRIFVVYAKCTHLGCTPDWKQSEQKFKCPCHGSGYDPEGRNYEGPAPRPMDRAKVELDPEGEIIVDTSVLFKEEKGKPTQFNESDSYIPV